MRLVVLFRPDSEHTRLVEDYVRDYLKAELSRKIEAVDLNSREGADMARLYDIVQYPAILAMTDDGQLQKSWQGSSLPLMDEVASYVREG